jgi:hypothetical protein
MKKYAHAATVFLLIMAFLLAACNEKGSGGGNGQGGASDTDDAVTVDVSAQTVNVAHDQKYDLFISGQGCTINIRANDQIGTITITGANNLLTIPAGTNVDALDVSGSDNTIYVPIGSTLQISGGGLGNQLIEQ